MKGDQMMMFDLVAGVTRVRHIDTGVEGVFKDYWTANGIRYRRLTVTNIGDSTYFVTQVFGDKDIEERWERICAKKAL